MTLQALGAEAPLELAVPSRRRLTTRVVVVQDEVEAVGLGQASRQLSVSATDGRKVPSSVDLTGNLYSNTVTLRCP